MFTTGIDGIDNELSEGKIYKKIKGRQEDYLLKISDSAKRNSSTEISADDTMPVMDRPKSEVNNYLNELQKSRLITIKPRTPHYASRQISIITKGNDLIKNKTSHSIF